MTDQKKVETPAHNLVRHDLPASFSREIGRILVKYAYLEHYVQNINCKLAGVDETIGRIAIREPRLRDRIEMMTQLTYHAGHHVGEEDIKKLNKYIEEITEVRDLCAHGAWFFDSSKNAWSIHYTRGTIPKKPHERIPRYGRSRKIKPQHTPVDIELLRIIVANIETIIEVVGRLKIQIDDTL